MALTPIRRVVTGNDERGRSRVIWDGPAPGTHESKFPGRGHTDFWVWRETPLPLDGAEDAGTWNDEFPGPVGGGHLRGVHWLAKTELADRVLFLSGDITHLAGRGLAEVPRDRVLVKPGELEIGRASCRERV